MGRRLCDTVIAHAYREAHAYGLDHFLSHRGDIPVKPGDRTGCFASDAMSFPWKQRFGRFEWEAPAALTHSCAISAGAGAQEARKKEAYWFNCCNR